MNVQRVLFIFLCILICLSELKIFPEIRDKFDGQKVVLNVNKETGEHILTKWYNEAHNAVIDCLARERYRYLPRGEVLMYEQCAKRSETIQNRSRCFILLEAKTKKMKDLHKNKVNSFDFNRMTKRKNKKKVDEKKKKRPSLRRAVNAASYSLSDSSTDSVWTRIARTLTKTVDSLFGIDRFSWNYLQDELKSIRKKESYRSMLRAVFARTVGDKGDSGKIIPPLADQSLPHFRSKRIRLLSPGIFPKDSSEVEILSPRIPTDSKSPEIEAFIDFIMSVSGTKLRIKEAINLLKTKRLQDEPIRLTESDVEEICGKEERRKIDVVRKMESMYTPQQLEDFRHRGFSFMTKRQQETVYGEGSPMENQKLLKETRRLNTRKLENRLLRTIRLAASGGRRLRQEQVDYILSPVTFSSFINVPYTGNTILSPVFFSVFVSSPTIIGPLILSPWVFAPIISSPWILAPIVLSPFAFSPLILSPMSLSVYVLSAGIFSPAILSPILMVPYILSPFVGSPLILSPTVLSPFIFNPTVGSPLILSPSVLSPAVHSPSINSSVILSPSVLSPLIESEAEGSVIFLSPSI